LVYLGEEQESKTEGNPDTSGTRIVQMALDFALRQDAPSVLVFDALFPSAAVFKLAASLWSIELQQPLVILIIRAIQICKALKT
jgi:hypothetical protein